MDENIHILNALKVGKKRRKIIRIKKNNRMKKVKKEKAYNSRVFFIFIFIIIVFVFFLYCLIFKEYKKKKNSNYKRDLETFHLIFNNSFQYNEFDENINQKYIQLQNYFCEKQNDILIQKYEKRIELANANFEGKIFDLFVFNSSDAVSINILRNHNWEGDLTKKVLKALDYYAKKKNVENKDVYLLDIGSNIGWYTYFLGKYGYKILSFEASPVNSYILYKNYCLNKDTNVTIINKGLDKEDLKCILRTIIGNEGDGMVFCENREGNLSDFNGEILNIELTRLSKYYKFLSNKNFAFIKMDVEGAEGNVIEGGEELISKYHVPFIMMEFEVKMLNVHKTKVLEFLKFFENNGYKISKEDFFSKRYISPEELIQNRRNNDLFIVYEKILE